MGGATIIPRSSRTTRNEKIFQDRPNWSKDDVLSYSAHRRGKTALYISRTFLRQATYAKKKFRTPPIPPCDDKGTVPFTLVFPSQ